MYKTTMDGQTPLPIVQPFNVLGDPGQQTGRLKEYRKKTAWRCFWCEDERQPCRYNNEKIVDGEDLWNRRPELRGRRCDICEKWFQKNKETFGSWITIPGADPRLFCGYWPPRLGPENGTKNDNQVLGLHPGRIPYPAGFANPPHLEIHNFPPRSYAEATLATPVITYATPLADATLPHLSIDDPNDVEGDTAASSTNIFEPLDLGFFSSDIVKSIEKDALDEDLVDMQHKYVNPSELMGSISIIDENLAERQNPGSAPDQNVVPPANGTSKCLSRAEKMPQDTPGPVHPRSSGRGGSTNPRRKFRGGRMQIENRQLTGNKNSQPTPACTDGQYKRKRSGKHATSASTTMNECAAGGTIFETAENLQSTDGDSSANVSEKHQSRRLRYSKTERQQHIGGGGWTLELSQGGLRDGLMPSAQERHVHKQASHDGPKQRGLAVPRGSHVKDLMEALFTVQGKLASMDNKSANDGLHIAEGDIVSLVEVFSGIGQIFDGYLGHDSAQRQAGGCRVVRHMADILSTFASSNRAAAINTANPSLSHQGIMSPLQAETRHESTSPERSAAKYVQENAGERTRKSGFKRNNQHSLRPTNPYQTRFDRWSEKYSVPETRDTWGNTGLHLAIHHGLVDLLKLLLRDSAWLEHIEKRNNFGESPLIVAAGRDDADAITTLIRSGALPDGEPYGRKTTALRRAVERGCLKAARALADHQADPNLKGKDDKNKSALELARDHGSRDMKIILKCQERTKFDSHRESGRPFPEWSGYKS